MFYTVYKTTHIESGRFYIGIHKTENPNDSYLGSGRKLKAAVRKHGRGAFKKEVLFIFDNAEEMRSREAELVDRVFVDREDTYNLVPGGFQGESFYQARKSVSSENLSAWGRLGALKVNASDSHRETLRERARQMSEDNRKTGKLKGKKSFEGRKHSEETKRKMSESSREPSLGERNSQYGTAWVCREGNEPRKIKMAELPGFLEAGWRRGRTVNPEICRGMEQSGSSPGS